MNFYHCTSTNNARLLLNLSKKKKFEKIKLSEFVYKDCLKYWLHCLIHHISQEDENSTSLFVFPRTYYTNGINAKVFWLGNGFYCFKEDYKDEAPYYEPRASYD